MNEILAKRDAEINEMLIKLSKEVDVILSKHDPSFGIQSWWGPEDYYEIIVGDGRKIGAIRDKYIKKINAIRNKYNTKLKITITK